MPQLDLFLELQSKKLAAGLNMPLGMLLPIFRQEDQVELSISAMKRVSEIYSPQYELQNLTAWAAQVTIGQAASALAAQNTFTLDASATKLQGTLDLNTAGINALTNLQQGIYFELILYNANGSPYGKRFDCRIEKAIYTTGTLVDPPGDVALGELKADRRYMRKEGRAGEGFLLTSNDGTKKGFCYWHDDGSFRAEAIS